MTDLPFRFTTDGELFDALNADAPPARPPRRSLKPPALAVCIVALLLGGVGAVRAVQSDDTHVPAASVMVTEASATG
jgi:hypothetical protein